MPVPYWTSTARSWPAVTPRSRTARRVSTTFAPGFETASRGLWPRAKEKIEGYAYASPFHPRPAYRWSVEVSVYVAPGGQGRGVGRDLLATLLADLHECGYVNAFAGIALPNDASVHLLESFGFEQIARHREVGFKLGEWHDVGWWQLHLRDRSIPPPDIRMRAQAAGADEAPA